MEERMNLFEGDISALDGIDLEAPLQDAEYACCEYYSIAYEQAAKNRIEGQEQEAETYRFLSIVTGFKQSFEIQGHPYGPRWALADRRSPIPLDLTDQDLIALEKIASRATDPALLARVNDLIWILKKDHRACAVAAEQYFEAGDRLDTEDGWTFAVPCYRRGLDLSKALGRAKDLYTGLCTRMAEAVRGLEVGKGDRRQSYIDLLLQFRIGDPKEFAEIGEEEAKSAEHENDFRRAEAYWETAANLWKRAGELENMRRCRLAVGESLVSQAQQKAAPPISSTLAAARFLERGIEALRQANADPERVKILRQNLTAYQKESLKGFKCISLDFDITDAVKQTISLIEGKSLEDALFTFALMHELIKPSKLRCEVEDLAENAPLTHTISATLVDDAGRPIANRDGLLQADRSGYEHALEAHMFNLAQKHWHFRAAAYIDPGRMQILNEHHPNLADLAIYVRHNPFIPPDHEYAYLRGIHAGFHGDFHVATSLLVPQIENSFRYILESQGIDVSNLNSDGTQPLKVLKPLIGVPELEQTLGEDVFFELRGLLLENSGYNFRNRVCHGFVSDDEFNSIPAVNIWWLVLRLCLVPFINLLDMQEVESEKGSPS